MVIYKRDRTGSKRKVGSSISPWDNVVATLPDMSSMISKTYVNEIDVSKVKAGQKVDILVDAFPEKKYTGSVISVANIGEQLPNADAKVFEVQIKVNGSDMILRPSMTTGNKIITKTINDVIYIPLESVQAGTDSVPFVYMKNGVKQVVVLGESNENNVIVEQGLEAGSTIYLNTPEQPEKFSKMLGQDLIAVIKEKDRAKKEAERQSNEAAQQNFGRRGGMMDFGGGPGGSGGVQGQRNGMQGGQGRTMDTAAMRRFQQMRNDTAAMRRFQQMRNNRQPGTRQNNQNGQQTQRTPRNQQTQETQQSTVNR
jgi:hypothetical protein